MSDINNIINRKMPVVNCRIYFAGEAVMVLLLSCELFCPLRVQSEAFKILLKCQNSLS